jgi:hypothetical protein
MCDWGSVNVGFLFFFPPLICGNIGRRARGGRQCFGCYRGFIRRPMKRTTPVRVSRIRNPAGAQADRAATAAAPVHVAVSLSLAVPPAFVPVSIGAQCRPTKVTIAPAECEMGTLGALRCGTCRQGGMLGMDLGKVIQDLYAQKEKLARTITTLEGLLTGDAPVTPTMTPKRRGRRSMGAAERQEVAARMSRYWAKRRASRTADAPV